MQPKLRPYRTLPAAPLTEDLNIQQPMLEHSAMYRKNHWVQALTVLSLGSVKAFPLTPQGTSTHSGRILPQLESQSCMTDSISGTVCLPFIW